MYGWTHFLLDLNILIEYSASDVIVVSCYTCVGPLPRTRISFLLLSLWKDEVFSTPKITTSLPQSKFGNEKSKWELNPITYPD